MPRKYSCARLAVLAVTAWLSLPLSAQQSAASQPAPGGSTVKVGVVFPLSGGSADFGQAALNGIQLAVDEVNAVGGYLGRKIELVVKDDKGDPETGLKVSQELADLKVAATIGFCNTGVAIKAIPVFQKAQIPLLVSCAAGSPVTKQVPAKDSYVFRVSPSEAIKAPFVTDDILRRGWSKVAIFHDATPYGTAGRDDVLAALAKQNLKPVHVTQFALGTKDLSVEMKKAREAGANVIFAYTVGPENAVIAQSREAIGWKVPLVGPWTLSFPNFIKSAGKAAEGTLMSQTFIAEPSNERRAAFLSAYAKKYNTSYIPVPMAAAQSYDATYLLLYSMFAQRDGNFTGATLKASLEDLRRPYYGVVTTYDKPFSVDDKDAITRNMLVMGVVKNGVVTFAYAEDAKKNVIVQRKQ